MVGGGDSSLTRTCCPPSAHGFRQHDSSLVGHVPTGQTGYGTVRPQRIDDRIDNGREVIDEEQEIWIMFTDHKEVARDIEQEVQRVAHHLPQH